ncbi:MAG: hypothetical protein QF793_01730 [Candidatus Peribacteraceae bacterium]|jgi:hypothetical protein|nr:hypothetical protein [Candidatus Peribacteraceae bacterium]|tara:strand:+ start:2767 stop:3396 length:630 start_codon:yes stop_codon:yes gene_type:complete
MVENPLTTIFGFIGSFYGLVLPLLTIFFLTVLFLASMSVPGAKPRHVGDAIYTFLMHGVSVLLMTIGALPTVFSVFAGVAYTGRTYIALLLVFACGGLLFLMQDQAVRGLDSASKAVAEAVYMTTLKIIGNMLALLSAISIFLSIVLASFQTGWWVTPFVLLLYGMLLSWCTKGNNDWELLKALQVTTAPARSSASRPKAKKRSTKKKR